MMGDALGMVEVRGLASAVAVADVMLKTANVQLVGVERARGKGWTTVKVTGDVGATKASVSAGEQKATEFNSFITSKVIPRPADDVKRLFCVSDHANKAALKVNKVAVQNKKKKKENTQREEKIAEKQAETISKKQAQKDENKAVKPEAEASESEKKDTKLKNDKITTSKKA